MQRLFDWLDRVLGVPAGRPTTDDGVEYWQNRVLDVAMVVAVILGSISVVPGVIRALAEANYILLVADIAVLFIALGVLLARGVAYRIRAGLLVAAAFGIGIVQVATSGLHTTGPLWLFAGPVVAAILFNLRTAIGLVAVAGLVLLAHVLLDHAGLLPPALAAEVGSPRWLEVATDLLLLSTVVSLFMGVLLQGLRTTLQRVQRVGEDLEADPAALNETNRERGTTRFMRCTEASSGSSTPEKRISGDCTGMRSAGLASHSRMACSMARAGACSSSSSTSGSERTRRLSARKASSRLASVSCSSRSASPPQRLRASSVTTGDSPPSMTMRIRSG